MKRNKLIAFLLSALFLMGCVTKEANGPETANANVFSTETHDLPECACLQETQDLWLCGLAEEPTPPYDFPDRDEINGVLIAGAMIGLCGTEGVEIID